MRVIVDVNHPAHIHFFKNFIREMREKGNAVMITASEKDVTLRLLKNYGLDYENMGSYGNSLLQKFMNILSMDLKMYRAMKKFNPDLVLGLGSIRASHAAFLQRKPCINLEDTECSREQIMLYLPFVRDVFTMSNFKMGLGKKQVRLDTFKELAYLHPDYFKPDPGVLDAIGLKPGERFIVMRFISWEATHDLGYQGISDRLAVIRELEKYGRVLISSEKELEPDLQKYRITLPPEKFHDLLYYAALYFGEGGTTASEAALMGTHAILIDPESKQCGVFYDLNSYGLLWFFDGSAEGLEVARELLQDPEAKAKGRKRLEKLISSKVNPTKFLVWLAENYPESSRSIKKEPSMQDRFK